jgi:hypothetical protein
VKGGLVLRDAAGEEILRESGVELEYTPREPALATRAWAGPIGFKPETISLNLTAIEASCVALNQVFESLAEAFKPVAIALGELCVRLEYIRRRPDLRSFSRAERRPFHILGKHGRRPSARERKLHRQRKMQRARGAIQWDVWLDTAFYRDGLA